MTREKVNVKDRKKNEMNGKDVESTKIRNTDRCISREIGR